MNLWKDSSIFASYIDEYPSFFSPIAVKPPKLSFDDESLPEATDALQKLASRITTNHMLSSRVQEVREFTNDIQMFSATMKNDQFFEKLQPLRFRLFWMPVTLVQADDLEVSDLIVLAHLYSVALAVDSALPELGGAALGAMTVKAIEEIDRMVKYGPATRPSVGFTQPVVDDLMHFPRVMLTKFHSEEIASQPSSSQPAMTGHHSPYGFQHLRVGSQPNTPGSITYPVGTSGFQGAFPLMQGRSLEELSNPASPYLRHGSPADSRPHSQLLEPSPALSVASAETQSQSAFSYRGSPGPSPGFYDSEHLYPFGEDSPGTPGKFVAPIMWA